MPDPKATEFTGGELLAALAAIQTSHEAPALAEAESEPVGPAPPRYQVVHLGTSLTSLFAILEPGGNVSARKSFVLETEFLTEEAMMAAVIALQQQARRHGREYQAEAPENFASLVD